jgi:LCP family protein required for cell wall assembly
VTTPRGPHDDPPSSGGPGLPPHLDPRGRKGPPPRVTNAYRQAARGGPAPTVLGPSTTTLPGPAPKGRRTRGQRTARVLSWLALTTAVVVLLAAGGLWVAFNHYNGQISRISIPGISGHTKPAKAPRNAENFLLVGSDSRDGENGAGTQGKGATFVTGQRSDTVILVHLFGNSDKAELVSFPRDSYVEIPAYTNAKTGHVTPPHHDKLNSAFSLGGPALLIATIENMSNIRIDHFLQIDFTGFKGMVNKLGGVDVCLTKAAKDSFSGIDLSAGQHHISGDVALAFVRQRHGLANGDIDRIARQQQFLGSLVHKVLSAGTLLNPLKLTGFLDVATASLQVDKTLSGNDLKNLALRLRAFNSGGVLFTTVPIADIGGRRGGASVVLLDDAKAEQVFAALRDDQAPGGAAPTAVAPTKPLTVKPTSIRITVFNGSGVQGMGRKAATDLAPLGYQLIGIPTNRGTGTAATTIFYGPTKADSARTLQASIPGSVLQADANLGRTLELVVGTGYTGAHTVTVTGTPSTATPTTGTSTAAAPLKTAAVNACTT